MRKFYLPLLLLCSAFILVLSCRKTDTATTETAQSQSSNERFFNVPASALPQVKALAQAIKRQDAQYHFVADVVRKAGYPVWDKAKLVISAAGTGSSRTSSEGDGEEVVYIPFVLDSGVQTSAVLSARLQQSDTTYRMLYAVDYRAFGYDMADPTRWNARDVFHLFSTFDYAVFGHTRFLIRDDNLFKRPDDGTQVVLSLKGNGGTPLSARTALFSYTVCTSYEECHYFVGGGGSLPAARSSSTNDYCIDYDICTTFSSGGGDGGSSGGPGGSPPGGNGGWNGSGDGTGNPGGGGGGNDGWWNGSGNPCPAARTAKAAPGDGCGPGWTPQEDLTDENNNVDGVESICNKSFKFKKFIELSNGIGGWQVAGVKNIHMNIVDLTTRKLVLLRLPVIYFGLPVIRANGDFYSTSTAAGIASDAVEFAEQKVMEYYYSLGGSLDVVGMSLFYRNKINEYMQTKGGSASLSSGSNINNVEITEAIYSGILGLNCL